MSEWVGCTTNESRFFFNRRRSTASRMRLRALKYARRFKTGYVVALTATTATQFYSDRCGFVATHRKFELATHRTTESV